MLETECWLHETSQINLSASARMVWAKLSSKCKRPVTCKKRYQALTTILQSKEVPIVIKADNLHGYLHNTGIQMPREAAVLLAGNQEIQDLFLTRVQKMKHDRLFHVLRNTTNATIGPEWSLRAGTPVFVPKGIRNTRAPISSFAKTDL